MVCIRANFELANLCCSLGLLLELKLFLHYGVVVLEARRMETNTKASKHNHRPRAFDRRKNGVLEQKKNGSLYARIRCPLEVVRASPL